MARAATMKHDTEEAALRESDRTPEKFYAYLATDATGSMQGRISPGQHILEREYKGNGAYTWTIYDFGKGEVSGTFSGVYVGIVHSENGKLTDKSKAMLDSGCGVTRGTRILLSGAF